MKKRYTEDMEPVECARGHMNDPYPEDGKCVECHIFLPGNPDAIYDAERARELNEHKTAHEQNREKRAKKYIEEAGGTWEKTDAIMQDLAIRYATTLNRHDGELLLKQLERLKAPPRLKEELAADEIINEFTAPSVGD